MTQEDDLEKIEELVNMGISLQREYRFKGYAAQYAY